MEERQKQYLETHSQYYRDTTAHFDRFCKAVIQELVQHADPLVSASVSGQSLTVRMFGREWLIKLTFAGSYSKVHITEVFVRENAPTEYVNRGAIEINHRGQILDGATAGMDYIQAEHDAMGTLLFKLLQIELHFQV